MSRRVEVFTGAYASGKSEISINRALDLFNEGEDIILVDLDTVEPAYTLRPIQKDIEKLGIKVITQENYFGLGETGNTITSEQLNCLYSGKDIVIDVGYGAGGLDILDVLNGIEKEQDLNIYMVINASKFETSTVESIVEYVNWSTGTTKKDWKKFSGIISNTHFSYETTREDVIRGYEITKKAAGLLNLPIIAICVSEGIYPAFEGGSYDGVPIRQLKRFMPKALW